MERQRLLGKARLEGKGRQELLDLALACNWWHSIDLGGVVTKGVVGRWPLIERAFDQIDFRGKKVLDIGCWDGLWSFEAEKRGAREVHSVDYVSLRSWSEQPTYQLAHKLLGSRARYYPNLSVYDVARLGVTDFDVVVYCGIYYHLLEPLRAFAALREVMKEGGLMVVEGPVLEGSDRVHADFSARTWFAEDPTNWWVPSMACLRQWLDCTYFDVITEISGSRDIAPQPAAAPATVPAPSALQRLGSALGSVLRAGPAPATPPAAPAPEREDRVSLIARATSIGERLARRVHDQALPALPDTPGITAEAAAGFAEAAARFCAARPWEHIRQDRTIRLDAPSLDEPAFMMVLGQRGGQRGLVIFFQRPAIALHLQGSLLGDLVTWAGFLAAFPGPDDDGTAEAVYNSGHGYPAPRPAHSLRRPSAGQLQLLEACLRAVPGFIEGQGAHPDAVGELSVPVSGGEVQITLSWVTEGEREL